MRFVFCSTTHVLEADGSTYDSHRSRHQLAKEHRLNKSVSTTKSQAYASLPKLPADEAKPADDEMLSDLDEDDFALGSGSDLEKELEMMSDMEDSDASGSLGSPSEDEGGSEAFMEDDEDSLVFSSEDEDAEEVDSDASDLERAYEARPRREAPRVRPQDSETRLPVRLPNGEVQRFPAENGVKPSRVTLPRPAASVSPSEASRSPSPEQDRPPPPLPRSDPFGGRFGRTPLATILNLPSKSQRVTAAREEIADLAGQIVADPELSSGPLKRLVGLAGKSLKSDGVKKPVKVEDPIRAMALLSLLAVFLDIIPGYRIRPLGEAEQDVQVSQQIARQREYESSLVASYKRFLDLCEADITSNSPLAPVAFKCLTSVLREKAHFNFSGEVMEIVVRKLGRREWDEASTMCLASLRHVLRKDVNGEHSLKIVRLVSRTVKAKEYRVHPELVDVLLDLRLKDEIGAGIRASGDKVYGRAKDGPAAKGKLPWKDRVNDSKGRKKAGKAPGEPVMSKKARKAAKEKSEIEQEIQEAEETVKFEERERNQTETLKLVFSLYFRIVKTPTSAGVLGAALEGLARFAHLVNVDFFKDLLAVFKGLIALDITASGDDAQEGMRPNGMRERLLCIVTAFELLSGQGEALNLDLTDFVNSLYALLVPLALSPSIERNPGRSAQGADGEGVPARKSPTEADLLFRALQNAFFTTRASIAPTRSLAFAKRILTATLHWPPSTVLRGLG